MELKENTTIVVLGASGDLAKKKTVRSDYTFCLDSGSDLFYVLTSWFSALSTPRSLVW